MLAAYCLFSLNFHSEATNPAYKVVQSSIERSGFDRQYAYRSHTGRPTDSVSVSRPALPRSPGLARPGHLDDITRRMFLLLQHALREVSPSCGAKARGLIEGSRKRRIRQPPLLGPIPSGGRRETTIVSGHRNNPKPQHVDLACFPGSGCPNLALFRAPIVGVFGQWSFSRQPH